MARKFWSATLGVCFIAPLAWSTASAATPTNAVATPIGREVRITRPTMMADGSIDLARTRIARTDAFGHADAATEQQLLTSGATLVAQPELGPTVVTPQTAALIHNGYTGRVRVGVIDFFSSTLLAGEISAGELSPIPSDHRKCLRAGKPCSFSTSSNVRHGNAMAEIISDQAPGAELFLAQAETIADYRAVIDWFAANDVKIVNHSLIGSYDGPGDGTGPQAAVVDYAVSKGMAWFNTAGDMGQDTAYPKYAGAYWRGTWNDPDRDGWLNFSGTDETLGTYCGALLGLRWSDWGTGRTDYELWVNDVFISTGLNAAPVVLSNRNQAGTPSATPIEGNDLRWLCNTNPALGPVYDKNKDGFVALKVKRSARSTAASSTGDRLEIQVNNGYLEYSVDGSSVGVGFADSKNPGAATIGHERAGSSHGPTNDGRIKPDLLEAPCSPTNATYAYGPCSGANQYLAGDSAAAKASGVAAAVLDALGPMRPAQLVQYFRNEAARDHIYDISPPHPVPNNKEGYGSLAVRIAGPQPAVGTGVRMQVTAPRHILDTRTPNNARFGTAPLARNSAIVFNAERASRSPKDPSRVLILNVTTSGTLQAGNVQIGPAGWTIPGATTTMVVQAAGQTVSTTAFVPVGPTEEVTIYTTAGGHFHVDLLGIYTQLTASDSGLGFHGVDPYRAYDTRTLNQPLAAGVARDVTIVGSATDDPRLVAPPGAEAVMVSLTADSPAASGYVSAVPVGTGGKPDLQTLQVVGGRASTTTTIVLLDALGRMRLWASMNTHIQVEVLGWFSSTMAGGAFHPMPAVRMADTRRSGDIPPAGTITDIPAADYAVPATADAMVGQLISIGSTSTGAMKIGRSDAAVSTLHRELSATTPNRTFAVATVTGLDNAHARVVAANATHRVFDAVGWFDEVGFGVPGTVLTAPIDPDRPNALRDAFAFSPDLNTIAYATWEGSTYGATVWRRDTGAFTYHDLDVGSGTPDAIVLPEAVSDDGTRIVFRSAANNLTPDSNDGGLEDWFVFDTVTTSVRRINEASDGTRIASVIAVDTAATTLLLQPDPIGAPHQLLSVDIATGATSTLGPRPRSGYNEALTAAADDTTFWTSRGEGSTIALTTVSPGLLIRTSVSPEGRYLYIETREFIGGLDYDVARLYDNDTATTTLLCAARSRINGFSAGGVDWSEGPPSSGTWCTAPFQSFSIVTAHGLDLGPLTYDGRLPRGPGFLNPPSTNVRRSTSGLVAFTTSAVNMVPGTNDHAFLYDRP